MIPPVRAKLQLTQRIDNAGNPHSKVFKFNAVYDPSIPEDARFAKATPTAELTMTVDNPSAIDQLNKLGSFFYVDFHPVQ